MPTNRIQDLRPDQLNDGIFSSPGRTVYQGIGEMGSGIAEQHFTETGKYSSTPGNEVNDAFLSDYGEDEINWEMSQADIDDGREG